MSPTTPTITPSSGNPTESLNQTIEEQRATIRGLRRKLIGLTLGLFTMVGFALLSNPDSLNTLIGPAEAQFEFHTSANGQADAPSYTDRADYPQYFAAADLGNSWGDQQGQQAPDRLAPSQPTSANSEQQRAQIYRQRMEQLRDRFLQQAEPDANTAIAINLYDMNHALSTLPIMAQQLQAMNQQLQAVPDIAEQMHDISNNIGVMTSGVDSTLGRIGGRMGGPMDRYGMGWPLY